MMHFVYILTACINIFSVLDWVIPQDVGVKEDMRCIFCSRTETDVVETRASQDNCVVRRRRECGSCTRRFTTYERVEHLPLIVIKRDGRRERFDRDKMLRGVLKSVEKTKVNLEMVDTIITQVERELKQEEVGEVESKKIGDFIASHLKELDKIAYIRFASVFRRFVDVEEFEKEIEKL